MKVRAAVLTYKPAENDRLDSLAATVASLQEVDELWVVDNGSGPDEVAAITDRLGFAPFTHHGPNHNCAHGTNWQARILAGASKPGDLCVLSDDDMEWRPGWRSVLEDWWRRCPGDVILTGCHLEPVYPWNEVQGRDDFPALYRRSTGAASWSYRRRSHETIFPIPERHQGTGDVPACHRLIDAGFKIAQLDLADHVGAVSTWGNRTGEMFPGASVDPVRALLAGDVA